MINNVTASAGDRQARAPRYSQVELNRSVDAHERFLRGEPRGQRAIWRYMQAPGCDFSRRLLQQSDLTGANLQGATLVDTSFERACLHFADLRAVDAERASFVRADLRGVSVRHANLSGALFDGADLRQAVLSPRGTSQDFRLVETLGPAGPGAGDVVFEVDFSHCSMRRARLANATLSGANFNGALLADADLTGADFRGASFNGAILTGVRLDGARIDPASLSHCLLDPSPEAVRRAVEVMARLAASDRWVDSGGVDGGPAQLDGEDLRPLGAVFVGRRLTAVSARRVCAVGMSFAGAQLQGGRFDDADLRDVDFTGADLRGASFRGARLRYAQFKDADMRPLPLASGAAREVDLVGADYDESSLSSSRRT